MSAFTMNNDTLNLFTSLSPSLFVTLSSHDSTPGILAPSLISLPIPHSLRAPLMVTIMLSIPLLFNYLVSLLIYHIARQKTDRQVPPTLPSFFPILGNTLPFLFDGASFVKRATSYAGRVTSTCVTLALDDIYLIQDAMSVAAMWKEPLLSSPIFVYAYGLQHVFGMPSACLEAYRADDSGPYKKRHPESNVEHRNRIDYRTHESLVRALSGPGMKPTFERIQKRVERKLVEVTQADDESEWQQCPDMLRWFRNVIGEAIIESMFGKRLLELNPTFMDDLWDFDNRVPWFAKRVPRFLQPQGYRTRQRLLDSIKTWYKVAREEFDISKVDQDGDGDPIWGSYLMRERQALLSEVDGQNDDGIAAADLGLIWTSVTNAVPSAMMANLHIWNNKDLLSRVQYELATEGMILPGNPTSASYIDTSLLNKLPLLNSIYAETLRCHVQAFITRCSSHADVPIGKWWLKKSDVAMVSSYVCHMDESLWNTKEGKHPVKDFWADRFLVDENDETSGPLLPEARMRLGLDEKRRVERKTSESSIAKESKGIYCNMKGLEGAWVPYGGGFGACPGRILMKKIMLWSCAHMISHYDVDVLTKHWEMDNFAFGFGTQKPKERITFRIRRKPVKI